MSVSVIVLLTETLEFSLCRLEVIVTAIMQSDIRIMTDNNIVLFLLLGIVAMMMVLLLLLRQGRILLTILHDRRVLSPSSSFSAFVNVGLRLFGHT